MALQKNPNNILLFWSNNIPIYTFTWIELHYQDLDIYRYWYSSRAHEFITCSKLDWCFSILVVCICVVDGFLSVCTFFFWTLGCLFFFNLRIMITPLVFSNSSWSKLVNYQLHSKDKENNIHSLPSYDWMFC